MKEIKEKKRVSRPQQPSYWESVLDLGIIIARHRSGLDKECFQKESAFISMP
jgi:hypothetical protein